MSSTYSWCFDVIPSNKDGILVIWATQAWTAKVSGHFRALTPLLNGAVSARGYQDRPLCDCCKDGIRDLSVDTDMTKQDPRKVKEKMSDTKKYGAYYVYYRKLQQHRDSRL